MTQLQHAPRRAKTLNTGIVATVAAVAIAVTILLGMLITRGVSLPTIGQGQDQGRANPALIQAEHDWQRQREQQGGFSDPLTEAERDWERQRKAQSPFDGE